MPALLAPAASPVLPPSPAPTRSLLRLLAAVAFGGCLTAAAAPGPDPAGAALLRELRSFREVGTVLYVAAHPDDENTEFITYFARGRAYRTGYLSLTRGDGGQNELGADFGEKLGVLRTQELLAARRLDGGRQFFSRAIDFGFSKTPEETLRFWDHDRVLSDVVRVIRQFRPDVIVTRFPIPPGSGGHGHHTASAILAVEAFKRAGDPHAFPEQLAEDLAPWQPKRILWNVFSWNRGPQGLTGPTIQLDIGGADPVSGELFGTTANRSRGMHRTQGLGAFADRPASAGPNLQSFLLLAGEPAAKDLMDGVDLTWSRIPGARDIGPLADDLLAHFDPQHPAASVPAVLALRARLAALPGADPLLVEKRTQLDRILQACLGLTVEATIARPEVVPGETFTIHHTARLSADFPVRWRGQPLTPGQLARHDTTATLPADAPLTQPYWLREAPSEGVFTVADSRFIGRPENPPAFPIDEAFEVGGQTLVVPTEPVAVVRDSARGELRRPLQVVGAATLDWTPALELLAPGATKTISLQLTPARAGLSGRLQLEAPPGWKASPTDLPFHLGAAGAPTRIDFQITAPAETGSARLTARAVVGRRAYDSARTELDYAHLPPQLLQPTSALQAVALDVSTLAKNVGYVPGAGDDVPASLRLLGCTVTTIDLAHASADELRRFDAIVLGVRAFNENPALAAHLDPLLAYVEHGGTVVAQYNRPNNLEKQPLGPYPLSIQGSAPQLRVTDEHAPVTVLMPGHRALTTPNRITAADFAGWIQERGAYFPSSWDEQHYVALLAMNDPGEPTLRGSLLVADYGSGHFVYTGLSFFRQLPAGVPGAYRLLANLISLGK